MLAGILKPQDSSLDKHRVSQQCLILLLHPCRNKLFLLFWKLDKLVFTFPGLLWVGIQQGSWSLLFVWPFPAVISGEGVIWFKIMVSSTGLACEHMPWHLLQPP